MNSNFYPPLLDTNGYHVHNVIQSYNTTLRKFVYDNHTYTRKLVLLTKMQLPTENDIYAIQLLQFYYITSHQLVLIYSKAQNIKCYLFYFGIMAIILLLMLSLVC